LHRSKIARLCPLRVTSDRFRSPRHVRLSADSDQIATPP
jgi:hypothetical protein